MQYSSAAVVCVNCQLDLRQVPSSDMGEVLAAMQVPYPKADATAAPAIRNGASPSRFVLAWIRPYRTASLNQKHRSQDYLFSIALPAHPTRHQEHNLYRLYSGSCSESSCLGQFSLLLRLADAESTGRPTHPDERLELHSQVKRKTGAFTST